jgi:hypothetical protein
MLDHVRAHQRLIAETLRKSSPRARPTSLAGYSVETVTRNVAVPLIQKYEWLGNVGKATIFVGLYSPNQELHGVACFGSGPAGDMRARLGPSLCLERGACVHYAPINAASFLINGACKLVHRIKKVPTFYAYCDPCAGEYGAVYQASGWLYLGQGLGGKADRATRYYVLAPDADRDNPANWKTTRVLRQGGRKLRWAQAKALGWEIAIRPAKHVYAINVGPKRKAWRKAIGERPYPAPRPELKRAARQEDEPNPMGVSLV